MLGFAARPSMAQPRAHVYPLRGLMNIFSLGMDTLAEKIQRHGIYATIHNYAEWQRLRTKLPPPITLARKARLSLLGIRSALMR